MDVITLIYYVGIISCAAQGAEKGKTKNYIPVLHYITNAFGGGFLRDVFILGVTPWILTSSAIPDLMIVVISGSLYTYYFFICKTDTKQYNVAMQLVTITDAFGLGSFICIGMDKAFICSDNIFIIITCGYVTAIGGGLIASGKGFTIFFENSKTVYYHLVTLLGCCYYYIYRHSFYLVCFVAIGLFMISIDYRNLYSLSHCNVIILYPSPLLLYSTIYSRSNNFQKQRNIRIEKNFSICPVYPKLYLVQRRLRQC